MVPLSLVGHSICTSCSVQGTCSVLLWAKPEHILTAAVKLILLGNHCYEGVFVAMFYIFLLFLALGKMPPWEHPVEVNPAARESFGLNVWVICLIARCSVFSLCICRADNLISPCLSALDCKILQSVFLEISVIPTTSGTVLIISTLFCTFVVVKGWESRLKNEFKGLSYSHPLFSYFTWVWFSLFRKIIIWH